MGSTPTSPTRPALDFLGRRDRLGAMPISDKSVVDSACPLARRFRDHAGRRNQEVFLAAGLAMVLKDGANGSAAT